MDKVQKQVTSKDGTNIAFEQSGSGPAVVLVASSLADRSDTKRLAALLAPHFTVVNYDRRGRGASGDTAPYAVEREVEDLEALIADAGGSACVFGSSSGAVLALEAAASGVNVNKLAVFEPPFVVDDSGPPQSPEFESRIKQLLAADRRSDAVKFYMSEGIGVPGFVLTFMRLMPGVWSKLKSMAHTIPYDITIMGDTRSGKPLDAAKWSAAKVPTLVMDGGKSGPAQRNAMRALVDVLPNAEYRTIEGQGHAAPVMAPKKVAPLLIDFFKD